MSERFEGRRQSIDGDRRRVSGSAELRGADQSPDGGKVHVERRVSWLVMKFLGGERCRSSVSSGDLEVD